MPKIINNPPIQAIKPNLSPKIKNEKIPQNKGSPENMMAVFVAEECL